MSQCPIQGTPVGAGLAARNDFRNATHLHTPNPSGNSASICRAVLGNRQGRWLFAFSALAWKRPLRAIAQNEPSWRVVARAVLASHPFVDADVNQATSQIAAEQKVVDSQSGVTLPALSGTNAADTNKSCRDRPTPFTNREPESAQITKQHSSAWFQTGQCHHLPNSRLISSAGPLKHNCYASFRHRSTSKVRPKQPSSYQPWWESPPCWLRLMRTKKLVWCWLYRLRGRER